MEKILRGTEEIAKYFGWSKTRLFLKQDNGKSRYEEMVEAGAIYIDMNPKTHRYTACAFPSHLRAWQILKTSKNRGKI